MRSKPVLLPQPRIQPTARRFSAIPLSQAELNGEPPGPRGFVNYLPARGLGRAGGRASKAAARRVLSSLAQQKKVA